MVNMVGTEGVEVAEESKRRESGVLLADSTYLLVEEVANNRVEEQLIDSIQHTIFCRKPAMSVKTKKYTPTTKVPLVGENRLVEEDNRIPQLYKR